MTSSLDPRVKLKGFSKARGIMHKWKETYTQSKHTKTNKIKKQKENKIV